MKNKNLALVIGALAIAGGAGWYFNQGAGAHAQDAGGPAKGGAHAPGQQPVVGADRVKVDAQERAGPCRGLRGLVCRRHRAYALARAGRPAARVAPA